MKDPLESKGTDTKDECDESHGSARVDAKAVHKPAGAVDSKKGVWVNFASNHINL